MTAAPPEFSIILPLADTGLDIAPCLASLARLTGPEHETLLVLHGSGCQPQRVQEQAAAAGAALRVLSLAPCPAGAARNFGAQQARGRVLVFSQADCTLPPDLLPRLAAHLAQPGLVGVGGACRPANPERPLARLAALELAYARQIDADLDTLSAAYLRQEFLAAGGFDPADDAEGLENYELSLRLLALGRELIFDPELYVKRPLPETWGGYLRLAYHRGRNRFRNTLHRRRLGLPAAGGLGQQAQSLLILLALGLPFALWPRYPDQALTLPLLCLLLLYPLNRRFLKFISGQAPELIQRALALCLLRPLAATAGLVKAALDRMGGGG
ncbi:MAG: glycosyltransferase family A protein [Thermodesulfobacteriota bacterium]